MTTTTINVHTGNGPLEKCLVLFAQRSSSQNMVCVSIESVDIFFHGSGQIRQAIEMLMDAERRMLVLEKEPQ